MAASYPSSVKTFTNPNTGDVIAASHVAELNDEVNAIEDGLLNALAHNLTIGTGTAVDRSIVFDGNAQDFYVALDDSEDDLVIGLGSAVGTTPAISVDENRDVNVHTKLGINETSNANLTIGLTINQGANNDQIFALKSSDVASGLTTTPTTNTETDDYLTITKRDVDRGGAQIFVISEATGGGDIPLLFEVYGGVPQTTDATTSLGYVHFDVIQHDDANARADMADDSNAFSIAEIDSGGTRQTRLILKADDGELHLGNTTLVVLADDDDDPQYARAMIHLRHRKDWSNDPYYKPEYNYEALRTLGVVGAKDDNGNFLIRVQPYLGMHDMCIWQLACRNYELTQRLEAVERKLLES